MTDFNNLNTNENVNPAGEAPNNPSPTEFLNENRAAKSHSYQKEPKIPLSSDLMKEKIKIRSDAQVIGSAFIVMYGVILLLNIIFVLISNAFRFAGYPEITEALGSPVSLQALEIIFSLIAFTLPFILIFRLSKIRISDLMCFSVPKFRLAVPLFLFGISFCSFANIASAISDAMFDSIFSEQNVGYYVPRPENPIGIYGFIIALVSTVIVPAFVEEFACRGLILGLLKKHGEGFAVVVSALLFGAMHGNFEQWPFAFLVGLVLGFITIKSGTLLIAIAVHAFNNFISIVFEYFLKDVPAIYQDVGYMIFLCICLLLGILAIFMLNGKDEGLYSFKPSKMKSSGIKKITWFFTSVTILIYTAICLFESLQFFEF